MSYFIKMGLKGALRFLLDSTQRPNGYEFLLIIYYYLKPTKLKPPLRREVLSINEFLDTLAKAQHFPVYHLQKHTTLQYNLFRYNLLDHLRYISLLPMFDFL